MKKIADFVVAPDQLKKLVSRPNKRVARHTYLTEIVSDSGRFPFLVNFDFALNAYQAQLLVVKNQKLCTIVVNQAMYDMLTQLVREELGIEKIVGVITEEQYLSQERTKAMVAPMSVPGSKRNI